MKKFLSTPLIIASLAFIFHSCDKKSNDLEPAQTQVEFLFSASQLKASGEQGLTNVVVSIEDLQGNVIKNTEKIELYNMNGNYISKPISLLTGEYKLTRFMVLDALNNVVYASPIEGSAKAYLVQEPLPILFTAQKDVVTKLSPEVLSTAESIPEDFGYATFSFEIVETFDFLVGAFVYNDVSQNFELTTAAISIYGNDILVYSGSLLATVNDLGITNKITLPKTYDTYTIKISKDGYTTYCKTFTKEELKLYYRKEDKGPLVVILSKNEAIPGLVAYYPFNGNANDESGYGNDGINYGATLVNDMNGKENSAYSFNGINNYIELNQAFDLPEGTFSMWVNARSFPIWDFPATPSMSTFFGTDNPELQFGSFSMNVTNKNGENKLFVRVGYMYGDCEFEAPLEKATWNHVVLSKDMKVVKVYLNGILISTENINTEVSMLGSPYVVIGASRMKNNRFFDGNIDEIRIYGRVLTEKEIQSLYNE